MNTSSIKDITGLCISLSICISDADRRAHGHCATSANTFKVSVLKHKESDKHFHLAVEANGKWAVTDNSKTFEGWVEELTSKQSWRLGNKMLSKMVGYNTKVFGIEVANPAEFFEQFIGFEAPVIDGGWTGALFTEEGVQPITYVINSSEEEQTTEEADGCPLTEKENIMTKNYDYIEVSTNLAMAAYNNAMRQEMKKAIELGVTAALSGLFEEKVHILLSSECKKRLYKHTDPTGSIGLFWDLEFSNEDYDQLYPHKVYYVTIGDYQGRIEMGGEEFEWKVNNLNPEAGVAILNALEGELEERHRIMCEFNAYEVQEPLTETSFYPKQRYFDSDFFLQFAPENETTREWLQKLHDRYSTPF